MSKDRKKPSIGFWITMIVSVSCAIPMLYLLILGPLAALYVSGIISEDAWKSIGYPAMLLGYHFGDYGPKWLWDLHSEYMNWWGTLAGLPQ